MLVFVPLHAVVAGLCTLWAVLVVVLGSGRLAVLPALYCLATAGWAAAIVLWPDRPIDGPYAMMEILRSGLAVGLLVSIGGRSTGAVEMARRFGFVGGALVLLAAATQLPAIAALSLPLLGGPSILARLALALLIVLIAENILRNVDEVGAWHAVLPCIAIGGLAGFDLFLYADAVLSGAFSANLLTARAGLAAVAPVLLVIGAMRDRRWRRTPSVSRTVVFQGATLLIAGAFLFGAGAVGEALRHFDADWGGAAEAGILTGALMALAVALSSRSFRSRIGRRVVDHFFAARYDYRAEWMRCTQALGAAASDARPATRAIRAIADAVDVPAGALLMRPSHAAPGASGGMLWAGSWNLPETAITAPAGQAVATLLGDGRTVVALGDGSAAELTRMFGPLWLAVPLTHHREGVIGAVLLARPRAPFALDAEVDQLLLTLGSEVAMFLAEREAAERLVDSRRLADYAKRFAFVAHDVKTVSNQLTLMLANAEGHMDDPEFQRDLLTTIRVSAGRINTLIARLRDDDARDEQALDGARPPAAGLPERAPQAFALVERIAALTARHAAPIQLEGAADAVPSAVMPLESFDAAFSHLLDNAVEASPPGAAVRVAVRGRAGQLEVDIIDRGPGMSAEFIRDALFRPLATAKPGGNGIGAWQARELLTGAGGSLTVLSRPGEGTTMRLGIPAAEVSTEHAATRVPA